VHKALVVIGTDGLRDFVTLPDGQRLLLGPVSVLKLVTELVPSRIARQALDSFLERGEVMVTVDLDQMYDVLAPRRARWSSSVTPSMPDADRTSLRSRGKDIMADTKTLQALIQNRLSQIEGAVASLDKHASEGLIAPKLHKELRELAAKVHLPNFGDQSKNHAFYGLGEPKVDTADGSAPPKEVTHPKTASFDTLKSNSKVAEDILQKVETTNEKIEQLVTAGRKFNASKAREDLYQISSRVAEILGSVDLAQSWVQNDLNDLAKQADHIHDLFAPAKV